MRIKSRAKTLEYMIRERYYRIQMSIKDMVSDNHRECNVCGWKGKNFYAFYNEMFRMKDETLCPQCNSCIYQRALAKYLQEECNKNYPYEVLEIAPHSSDPVRNSLPRAQYISIDIVKGKAMVQMDLRNLQYKDNSFDIVVCSAVLEHIKEDFVAMTEMYRVLKPTGVALMEIPMGYYKDPFGTHTVEFVYKQPFYEHYRSYGWEVEERFKKAGFKIRIIHYDDFNLGLENSHILGFFEGRK